MKMLFVRLTQVVVAGAIALSLAACQCPSPLDLDQVYLLNASPGSEAPIDVDSGQVMDAMSSDADAMSVPPDDAGVTTDQPPTDCTPAAAGCTAGGPCMPACTCVFQRDGIYNVGTVLSCTLVARQGPPQVEVHYQQPLRCPGG